jgi:hypothetical protein
MTDCFVKHHKFLSVRFKQQGVSVIDELMKSRLSIHQALDHLQIHHRHDTRWKNIMTIVDDLIRKDEVLLLTAAAMPRNFIRVIQVN